MRRTASLHGSDVLRSWLNKLGGDSLTEILSSTKAAARARNGPTRRGALEEKPHGLGCSDGAGSPSPGRAAGRASASGPRPTVTFGRGSLIPED